MTDLEIREEIVKILNSGNSWNASVDALVYWVKTKLSEKEVEVTDELRPLKEEE